MQENQEIPEKDEEKKEDVIEVDEEVLDFNNPDFSYVPPAKHQWQQRGPYLICKSCSLEHAIYIGMEKIMVGEKENGEPILKSRTEFERE